MSPDRPGFAINGYPWEIPHMLIRSRQLIEKRCLAAVLVASKGEYNRHTIGNQRLIRALMLSGLSDMRMAYSLLSLSRSPGLSIPLRRLDLDA